MRMPNSTCARNTKLTRRALNKTSASSPTSAHFQMWSSIARRVAFKTMRLHLRVSRPNQAALSSNSTMKEKAKWSSCQWSCSSKWRSNLLMSLWRRRCALVTKYQSYTSSQRSHLKALTASLLNSQMVKRLPKVQSAKRNSLASWHWTKVWKN